MSKSKTLQIGDMNYWSSGDDIGECDDRHCTERAFSYNEDGTKYCEECLEEWHENEDRKARRVPIEPSFKCEICSSVHETKGKAEICCDHYSVVYVCPECGEAFDEETEAQECCE